MLISRVSSNQISFKSIQEEYRNNDIKDREEIRKGIERDFNATYEYLHQIGILNKKAVKHTLKGKYTVEEAEQERRKKAVKTDLYENPVDVESLKDAKIHAFRERSKNKIYTGEKLAYEPEKLDLLKKSGINTVLCLITYPEYQENAKAHGLNFIELPKIGNHSLSARNFKAIKSLINNPEFYVDGMDSKEISDLKDFVDIVQGRNAEYPHPLYMGCQWGTDRTFEWYSIADILKDQSRTEPLSKDRVEKLTELIKIIEY